jgi:two-component system NtrC family response regulator/two-component system response regulator AtoC
MRLNELEHLLRKALEQGALQRENRQFRERNKRGYAVPAQDVVISASPAMRDLLTQAQSVAPGTMPILITGETGVGKEVLAAFIHRHSPRFERILSTVNCGALTDTLMDAELFGHERGSFTGATERRLGMLEVADGGTLFLDEIGEMPLPAQVRLLRFLEQGVVRRVGATREHRVNVRVIAATHRDLTADVVSGRFREDLFHRLCVIPLHIPPLRERREDILPLAQLVLSRIQLAGGVKTLEPPTEAALLDYPWPGNVRELAHAIERAVFNAKQHHSDTITPDHLQLRSGAKKGNVLVSLKEAEQLHIVAVLEHFQGNRQKAAKVLGVSERHLYRLLRDMESQNNKSQNNKGVDRTIPA